MSIDSEVVIQILRRSPQGFTPFEVLDYLLTQPQYQGCSRASLFSKLLPELQNLRDSQVVAHVSPRWVLVEALENTTERLIDQSKDAVSSEENSKTQASVSPNGSDEDSHTHLQEWTPQVGDKVLVKGRGSTLFSVLSLIYIGSEIYAELSHPLGPQSITIKKPFSELILADYKKLKQNLTEPNNSKFTVAIKQEDSHVVEASLDVPIEKLNISLRAFNSLKKAGINTVRELEICSDEGLLGLKNFGQTSLTEVRSALATFQPPLKSTPNQEISPLPEWANIPSLQVPTYCLSISVAVRKLVSKYRVVAHLIFAFEAGQIFFDSQQEEELKAALDPFQALRDAPQSYLDWLASLSKSTQIEVLAKKQWTPERLRELSPQQVLFAIPSDASQTTLYALISGQIPSRCFTTIAEEIDDALDSLNDKNKIILKQRLGLYDGNRRSLEDIGQELELTRERVRQIVDKAINKLNAFNKQSILIQFRQVAINTLKSAGSLITLQKWCEAISKIYPPGEVHLPSVILWLVDFIPEIQSFQISKTQFFYTNPLTHQILSDVQPQLAEFWEGQRISERSQLQQIILALLPQDILNPETVANSLINVLCQEAIPGIFSAEAWNITDYAYYVLHQAGKPLHFSEVGQRIQLLKPDWKAENIERSAQGAIERHPDIIRCGSGIYGLREWGTMEYSHFREVLLDYLSKQPLPVDAEDIYVELSQSYPVTRATVSMNLNLHPNLFHKFGRSNIYGVAGRRYELPEQNLINLLVAKLEVEPVSIYALERDPDFCEYNYKTINLYLNVSPLFWQVSSSKDKKFALSVDGKRKYEVGDALKMIQEIFNQVHEPLHSKDFLHMIRSSYAYPPREGAFGRILTENKDYITITEAIFIPRVWMSDEALSPILEDLDTEIFREIVAFTLSSARKQLSASVLFDWLKFCYRNRFFYRGSLIFERINLSDLSDEIVQITRKIGKVCQRNGDISVLNLGQDANSQEIDRTLRLDLEDLRQQAQSGQRTPSKGLASKPDGKYRVRHVEVGIEVHVSKGGGTDNPYAHVLQVLLNGEPFDPSRHNPIPANTATLEQRQQALQKLYATELTAYGQVDSYLQVAIGPRPSWGIAYRQMEPITEPATGGVA
ncbi:hypothetical protein NG798_25155 [Ancylothrix sp. C2]|uniref:DNA-directed RNA polymerase subunit alpha C-terminal domain-containing protein n=1 Tax=Ancylothrix sp. D3o TaxID=2953691 RepID=UPI0021BA7B15|nr:DNA-directed RNA polymerase subunit alpha C-terminal domain-containing protein [Ancylothrix sp. D3o]MCT7953090.1 hypothetical protein [Ancylothrix sp. D3o]